MKISNPAALPPCYASFEQQAFRSNLVANMWSQAQNPRLIMWDKTKHGYKVLNGKCALHWFEGDEVPDITYREPQEHEKDTPTEFDSSDESESENSVSNDSDSEMDW